MLDLSYYELNTQADDVGNEDIRQHGQQTETERFPEQGTGETLSQLSGSEQVLITGIEHTEEECGYQSEHYDNHRALGVRTVMDMGAVFLSGGLRSEQEGIEGVIERAQLGELTAFFEVLTELLPNSI